MSPLLDQTDTQKKGAHRINDERLCSNKGYAAFYKELRNRCATDIRKKSLQFLDFVLPAC